MADPLGRFLSPILLVAALVIAMYLFLMLVATAGYSTYSERASFLGFIGIILTLVFIGFRLDNPEETKSSRQPQSDIH